MRYRLLALMSALVAVIIFSRAAIFVSGQVPTPAARTTSTAKTVVLLTPWGEPDLQGIWTDEHQTPLQRPTAYAGREFLTEAEIAALDKERATTSQRPRVRPGRGSEADVAGAYSGIFLSVVATARRK